MNDIIHGQPDNYIVIGWFTPDYKHWADRIFRNLQDLNLPHDFTSVLKPKESGWEKTTMMKPAQVLHFMDRYPDKILILLDVDCEVRDREKLLALRGIPGDVGFYLRTKFRRGHDVRFATRSGTMVFKPTEAARQFVRIWHLLSEEAPEYAVDQDSLAVAIGKVPECVLSFLDIRYCAVKNDDLHDPWVLHDSASKGHVQKTRATIRRLKRLFAPRVDERMIMKKIRELPKL